jgi:acyl-CoA thioester hydrolase
MMDIPAKAFTRCFTAGEEHIDELGHVNNAVWVQWIQEVSTSHWAARADAGQQATLVWVVVRHEVDYHRPLLPGQTVTAHTWVADAASGAKFDRHMAFIGEGGVRHVTARTTWAMLDRASGRPMRVRGDIIARFSEG